MPKIKITEKDTTGLFEREGLSNVVYIPGLSKGSEIKYIEVTEKPEDWDTNFDSYFLRNETSEKYESIEKSDVAPEFVANKCFKFEEGSYTEVTEEPEDWDDNFDSYFEQDENDQLISVKPLFIYCYKEEINPSSGEYEAIEPQLYYTLSELNNFIRDNPNTYNQQLLSFKIMKCLLRLGLPVLYEQVTVPITDWSYLEDKNLYDIRFLTSGAEMVGSNEMVECAAKRGDCIALIDHEKTTTTVEGLRTFFKNILSSGEDADKVNSCAAGFTPWFTLAEVKSQPDLLESEYIPASFGYLMSYAVSIQNNPEWYAAAGSYRGVIPNIKSLKKTFTMSEVEILQGRSETEEVDLDDEFDNNGFAINVITRVNPFGDIVWGNRTLLENKGTLKATSFLNVRNLVSAVKKQLYFTAKKYTFEQNSDVLWVNFKSQLTPLLDQMQSGNGIAGYKIEKLPTNKKARLKAKITIIPIEAVEDFELEVELADSLEVIE